MALCACVCVWFCPCYITTSVQPEFEAEALSGTEIEILEQDDGRIRAEHRKKAN